jgi:hypothetical protein
MLTVLQEKLAEAHALAMAASVVTAKVARRVPDVALRDELLHMRREADETRARCLVVEQELGDELAAELLGHANATNERAADLANAWFKAGTGPLAAWSFLAMAEAAEVVTWRALAALAEHAAAAELRALAAWALPVQERHLAVALDGAARLAAACDPTGPRWG